MKHALTAGLALALLSSACGKEVDLGPLSGLEPGPGPNNSSCAPEMRQKWQFVQPDPVENRSVDLLFVVDTSSSLNQERAKLAADLPSFVQALSAKTDYQIGVMPAHGGASAHSGKLYSATGIPRVLSSKKHTQAQIQSGLRATLSQPVADKDEADGEMMLYSLQRGLEAAQFSATRAQGFFRENAAWSVILVSDENDVCFDPRANGYSEFPDYVASYGDIEAKAFKKYCVGSDGALVVSPASVLSKLQALHPARPLSFAALIHTDPARIARVSEDSIGRGLIELLKLAGNSVTLELSGPNYSDGLAQLGNVVSTQLDLWTAFPLAGAQTIDTSSIQVSVDQQGVVHTFDSSYRTVKIDSKDAGSAGSLVEISACVGSSS